MATYVKLRGRLKEREQIRVMGFDVGKANPAWSVVEVGKNGSVSVVHCQMAKSKITSFSYEEKLNPKKPGDSSTSRITPSNFSQVKYFGRQIQQIIEDYGVDYAVVERFQNRGFGRTGGEASEFCGLIVGVIATNLVNNKVPYFLIPASTWKTQFNNQAKLNIMPGAKEKIPLKVLYKMANVPEHVVDSVLMGIYGGMQLYGQVPFENFGYNWVKDLLK